MLLDTDGLVIVSCFSFWFLPASISLCPPGSRRETAAKPVPIEMPIHKGSVLHKGSWTQRFGSVLLSLLSKLSWIHTTRIAWCFWITLLRLKVRRSCFDGWTANLWRKYERWQHMKYKGGWISKRKFWVSIVEVFTEQNRPEIKKKNNKLSLKRSEFEVENLH